MEKIDTIMSKHQAGRAYAKEMESYKWALKIPFIRFPMHWQVRILPPFIGAVVRFEVKYKDILVRAALDCYGLLEYSELPQYWSITSMHSDIQTCAMEDTEELIKLIEQTLDKHED